MKIELNAIQLIKGELEHRFKIGNVKFMGIRGCIECGSMENEKTLVFEIKCDLTDAEIDYEERMDYDYRLYKEYAKPEDYELDIEYRRGAK